MHAYIGMCSITIANILTSTFKAQLVNTGMSYFSFIKLLAPNPLIPSYSPPLAMNGKLFIL